MVVAQLEEAVLEGTRPELWMMHQKHFSVRVGRSSVMWCRMELERNGMGDEGGRGAKRERGGKKPGRGEPGGSLSYFRMHSQLC